MTKSAKQVLKETDLISEEKKLKGLINSTLAQHLYFVQNFRKDEEKLKFEKLRFENGIKQMRKKVNLTRKRRKKSEAYAASQQEKLEQLRADNSNAKQTLRRLHQSVESYKQQVTVAEIDLKHDMMALEGLDSDIAEQVNHVLRDISDIDRAIHNWTLNSQAKIDHCRAMKEQCYSSFDDWSKLWPGIHSWLNAESGSLSSARMVSALQGIIGEWRSLRAVAIAIKQLNASMETAVKNSKSDPSQPPYDYNEPLDRLKEVLRAEFVAGKGKRDRASKEVRALDSLRRRLKGLLMDAASALESDMVDNMRVAEKVASKSLNNAQLLNSDDNENHVHAGLDQSSSVVGAVNDLCGGVSAVSSIAGGHTKQLIECINQNANSGTKVKHWMLHTVLAGDLRTADPCNRLDAQGSGCKENIIKPSHASSGSLSTDEFVRIAQNVVKAGDMDDIRMGLGLAEDFAQHYEHVYEQDHHGAHIHPQHGNNNKVAARAPDNFDANTMTATLAGLECRKALNDVQWAVEKYKATLSRQLMSHVLRNDPNSGVESSIGSSDNQHSFQIVEEENRREIEAQLHSFNNWMHYQITGKQLSCALNVPFPCPMDWLVKEVVTSARILNSREFIPKPSGPSTGVKKVKQTVMAMAAAAKFRKKNGSAEAPELTIRKRGTFLAPGLTGKSRASSESVAIAPTADLSQHSGLKPSELASKFGKKFSVAKSDPVQAGENSLFEDFESDDEDNGSNSLQNPFAGLASSDHESPGGSTPRRSGGGARGESIRESMNRVFEEASVAEESDAGDDGSVSDRLLVQRTSKLKGGAGEAMALALYWQADQERLWLTVSNIKGSEGFAMFINQMDVQNIFEEKNDLKFVNITNHHICEGIVDRIQIERVSRVAAYNLLMAAKTVGVKKAAQNISLTPVANSEKTPEDDSVRILTIRNAKKELVMCSVARMKIDHMQNLAKALPKREPHVGSVEFMLGQGKAKQAHGRATVF